jgi:ubiquinone/menaquinone biosynthesis C-methylase UbiE
LYETKSQRMQQREIEISMVLFEPNRHSNQMEFYSIGYSSRLRDWMQSRTAAHSAGFFLPHFRDGMTLLDCGCGPGSITIDFAELTPSGHVVGIDRELTQLQSGIELAKCGRKVQNVYFIAANVYELPIQSGSFDATFAHTLLMHLKDPLRALKEMRRVLKPGGIVGLADPDFRARVIFPTNALMEQFQDLYLRVLEFYGASLYYARQQRNLLLRAGFSRSEGHAFGISFGNQDSTLALAKSWDDYASSPAFTQAAYSNNWVDPDTLASMRAEIAIWGQRPDSYLSMACCTALAWA